MVFYVEVWHSRPGRLWGNAELSTISEKSFRGGSALDSDAASAAIRPRVIKKPVRTQAMG
jgi:hypothetical protein